MKGKNPTKTQGHGSRFARLTAVALASLALLVVAGGGATVGAAPVERVPAASQFVTKPGTAVFWSGLGHGGEDVAAAWASRHGGTTLEQLIRSRQIALPEWDSANAASARAWQNASRAFARGASGRVRALLGPRIRKASVWLTIELPTLRANRKVTRIVAVSASTGATRVLLSR